MQAMFTVPNYFLLCLTFLHRVPVFLFQHFSPISSLKTTMTMTRVRLTSWWNFMYILSPADTDRGHAAAARIPLPDVVSTATDAPPLPDCTSPSAFTTLLFCCCCCCCCTALVQLYNTHIHIIYVLLVVG